MDYHLYSHGQNLGVFPLEELRRRRASGELEAEALVWREGMSHWAALDSVLGPERRVQPPPLPASVARRQAEHQPNWGVILAAVLGVATIVVGGFIGTRFVQNFRRDMQVAMQRGSNEGADAAGQAVVVGTNSLTEANARQRGRQFRIRQYIEEYRKKGPHTAAWDHDASQLMEAWVAFNYGGTSNLPSPQVLSDKLAALSDCQDPLVLTAAAANAGEVHEKIRRLERALAAFPNSPYHAYPKFFVTVSLAAELGSRSPRIRGLDQEAVTEFKRAFADGSFEPGDEEEVAEILVNGWGHAFMERNGTAVCQAARQAAGYPWLALVLDGDNEITEAWKARGGGWANSVTDQEWQSFSDHLAKAQAALIKAWKSRPQRPLAPARMITIAMAESNAAEMRTWFDRAIEAQIDYPQAWAHMRWGLRPRWQGSLEAMLALGFRAVDTKRFDTDVPRKFFDCINDVESELNLPAGQHIYGRPDIWPHLQQMYEGYLAEPSQKEWQTGWRSSYTAVAFLAGKYDVARQQLEAMDWKPQRQNLTGWSTDLSLLPLQVAAFTGTAAGQVRRAESRYHEHDLGGAVQIYTELTGSSGLDARTHDFCRARLAALQQEALLAKGQWIDFLPADDKDPNWEIGGDRIHRLSDGALEVESGPQGHGFYSRTRVGPDFEITGECEFVRSSTRDFQAGLILGLPDAMNSDWYAFRLKHNADEGQIASFSRGWSTRQVAAHAVVKEGRNSFKFRLQNGKADAWVNDTQVLQQAAPEKNLRLTDRCLVGLGAYNDMNETVVRYRNIRLHRLSTDR